MLKQKIRKFLENYYQDTDGQWVVKTTPGYGQSVPYEWSAPLNLLKELSK